MSGTGQIDIQPAELRNLAADIGNQRNQLQNLIDDIDRQMNSLESDGLEDKGGREARANFKNFRNSYNNTYPPAFSEYIEFLNRTADNYERLEEERRQEASNLSKTVK